MLLDGKGLPLFDRLSWRSRLKRQMSIEHSSRTEPAAFFAFDLLELGDDDVRQRPLTERKAMLARAIATAKRIRYTDHIDDGVALFAAANELGLEGIVAKRADSPYRRGRNRDWVKIKTGAGRAIDEERAKWNER